MHTTKPAPNRTGFLYVTWVYCQIPVLYASVSDSCHLLAASRSGEVSSEEVVQAQQARVRCWDSLDSVLQSEDQKPAPNCSLLVFGWQTKKPLLAPTCCRDAGEMQVKGWSHCRGGCFVLVLEVRGLLPSTRCKLLCGQKSSCPPPLAKELAGRYTLVVCSSALNTLWFRYTVQVQCTCTVYRYGAHCAVYSV